MTRAALFALLASSVTVLHSAEFQENVTVRGDLAITHTTNAVKLEISGPLNTTLLDGGPGLWMNYDELGATPLVTFGINRYEGEWRWQMATDQLDQSQNPVDRLQMRLSNGNTLTLFNPADDSEAIKLDPSVGEIRINGIPLLSAQGISTANGQITITGGLKIQSGGLQVLKADGTSAVHVAADTGFVGLGTANPQARLEVAGAVYSAGGYNSGNNYSGLVVGDRTDPSSITVLYGHGTHFRISHGGVDQVVIDLNGRVGLGVAYPQQRLHVGGDAKVDGVIRVAAPAGDIPMFDPNH